MNHSFYTADRTTYSKVVIVALICATAVAGVSIVAHSGCGNGLEQTQPVSVIKAGKPAMLASGLQLAIR